MSLNTPQSRQTEPRVLMEPFRETELGLERRCSRCGEFWPFDEEFFRMKNGKPLPRCLACDHEDRNRQKREKRARERAS